MVVRECRAPIVRIADHRALRLIYNVVEGTFGLAGRTIIELGHAAALAAYPVEVGYGAVGDLGGAALTERMLRALGDGAGDAGILLLAPATSALAVDTTEDAPTRVFSVLGGGGLGGGGLGDDGVSGNCLGGGGLSRLVIDRQRS